MQSEHPNHPQNIIWMYIYATYTSFINEVSSPTGYKITVDNLDSQIFVYLNIKLYENT